MELLERMKQTKKGITYKEILVLGIILMACGIFLSIASLYSATQDLHNVGTQALEKGEYYIINPPEIDGIYLIQNSTLSISLYPSGTIEVFIDGKMNISSYEEKTTKIIDLNYSAIPILIYVAETEDELLIEYDYHITCHLRPFAWLAIPASVCALVGVVLTQASIIVIISTKKT